MTDEEFEAQVALNKFRALLQQLSKLRPHLIENLGETPVDIRLAKKGKVKPHKTYRATASLDSILLKAELDREDVTILLKHFILNLPYWWDEHSTDIYLNYIEKLDFEISTKERGHFCAEVVMDTVNQSRRERELWSGELKKEQTSFSDRLDTLSQTAEEYLRAFLPQRLFNTMLVMLMEAAVFACKGQVRAESFNKLARTIFVNNTGLGLLNEGGSDSSYNLSLMPYYYRTVYPKWQDSKRIYKKHQASDWRTEIKDKYADLPDDLLDWLPNDQGSEIQARVNYDERLFLTTPAQIAYEHAARLCGVHRHTYPPSYLKNRV